MPYGALATSYLALTVHASLRSNQGWRWRVSIPNPLFGGKNGKNVAGLRCFEMTHGGWPGVLVILPPPCSFRFLFVYLFSWKIRNQRRNLPTLLVETGLRGPARAVRTAKVLNVLFFHQSCFFFFLCSADEHDDDSERILPGDEQTHVRSRRRELRGG